MQLTKNLVIDIFLFLTKFQEKKIKPSTKSYRMSKFLQTSRRVIWAMGRAGRAQSTTSTRAESGQRSTCPGLKKSGPYSTGPNFMDARPSRALGPRWHGPGWAGLRAGP